MGPVVLQRKKAWADLVGVEVITAGDLCQNIRELERLLEMPIGCVVAWENATTLCFVFPAEAAPSYIRLVLGQVAAACQDASKSL